MARHHLRQSDLVAFDNTAAGHDGVLTDTSGACVIKPCTTAEIAFYETAALHPAMAAYMPTFMGTLQLSTQESHSEVTAETAATPDSNDSYRLRGQKLETGTSIVLENAAWGFKRPNILDVKLGAQLWDEGAKPEKRMRLDKVAAETTSSSLGFRIAGMKVWQGAEAAGKDGMDKDGYRVFDKMYGRKFAAMDVQEGFKDFLFVEEAGITEELGRRLARRFAKDVTAIQKILEGQESRMYSASILFVYEGDGETLVKAFEEEKNQLPPAEDDDEGGEEKRLKVDAVKLIDFAHATWTPGQGPDENVLKGVISVARIMGDLAD